MDSTAAHNLGNTRDRVEQITKSRFALVELIPRWVKMEAARRERFATIEPNGERVMLGVCPTEANGPIVRRVFRRAEYDSAPDACWRSVLAEHAAQRPH